MTEGSTIKGITSSEEKELRRVFDTMCNYLPRTKLMAKLEPLRERRAKILAHQKTPDVKVYDQNNVAMTDSELEEELNIIQAEITTLEAEKESLASDSNKKIRAPDLNECLKSLGKICTKKEVDEMIWEVDENLDQCVDWEEFKLTFKRNVADKTGLEPFQLFNVVQFMMYDKDGSGQVTVDETMHMLYTRYGKDNLESQMKALFGEDLRTADGDGELSFVEYLKAVNLRVPRKPGEQQRPPKSPSKRKKKKSVSGKRTSISH